MRVPLWAYPVAAAVLVGIAGALFHAPGSQQSSPVHVARVFDVPGDPPPADERLLVLTYGAEAVAMRRPTEFR